MGTSGVLMDKNKIIQALHKNKGVIMHTADALGCDAKTIYLWMDRDKEVKEAVDEARASADKERQDLNHVLKAKAYKSAQKLLDRNDCTMTIFTMKTLCGFEEKNSVQPLKLEIINYSDRKNNNDSVQV